MKSVVVAGTLSYDFIMDFPGRFGDRIMPEKLHCLSLSFLVDKLSKQHGGTAGNIAYTLKLLGIEPQILATGGNDFGPYLAFLKKHKISTQHIVIHKDEGSSGYFVITDQDDNQIGSFYIGAMKYAKRLHIQRALLGDVQNNFVVIAATDPQAMKKYVQECRNLGASYMYDPSFQVACLTGADLRAGIEGAEICIGNDYEIALIEQTLEVSHEELVAMVPILVTTLGAKGSIIETRHDSIHVQPAKPKNTTDPTGAGDVYRAGFLAGFLRGFDLEVCGQMGSVAAVYTVEAYGTQTHYFTKKEFVKRYEENYQIPISL